MTTTDITFGAIATAWLDEKRQLVKRSTFCAYLLTVRTHLLPAFATSHTITETRAQAFVFEKLADGLSRKSVHDILAVLKAILKYGARHHHGQAPDWDITFPTSTEHRRLPVLSLTDHRRLLRHLTDEPMAKNIGILLALCTGMRIGEVCALCWSDINFPRRVITVGRTAGRVYNIDNRQTERILSSPKTRSSNREIPISSVLYSALRTVQKHSAGQYVVGNGTQAADPRTYREYFTRLLHRLGIPHIVFHGLRHTFATRCIESQCDYKTVSAILGHSNIATTLNLYVHPDIAQKKRCIDRMTRALSQHS